MTVESPCFNYGKYVNRLIDCQPEVWVSCSKCHGVGSYKTFEYDEEISCIKIGEKAIPCELCHGTGKLPLSFYEEIQHRIREADKDST